MSLTGLAFIALSEDSVILANYGRYMGRVTSVDIHLDSEKPLGSAVVSILFIEGIPLYSDDTVLTMDKIKLAPLAIYQEDKGPTSVTVYGKKMAGIKDLWVYASADRKRFQVVVSTYNDETKELLSNLPFPIEIKTPEKVEGKD